MLDVLELEFLIKNGYTPSGLDETLTLCTREGIQLLELLGCEVKQVKVGYNALEIGKDGESISRKGY